MVKIAVCDDEVDVLHHMKELLQKYPKAELQITTYQSSKELAASSEGYDIILLDIDMEEMNGLEAAEKIRERDKNVKIIFVTGYREYTIYAFAVHAFAYLIKPVKEEELFKQLEEAVIYQKAETDTIIDMISTAGVIHQAVKDIMYCEYQNRYIILRNSKEKGFYKVKGKIKEMYEKLKPYHFALCHKSFIVNLFYVKNIKGYDIIMEDGSILPLSQKKSADLRRELNMYLSSCIEK